MMRRKGDVVGAFLHELDPLPTSLFLKLLFFFFFFFNVRKNLIMHRVYFKFLLVRS